jgi:hypothetical protein
LFSKKFLFENTSERGIVSSKILAIKSDLNNLHSREVNKTSVDKKDFLADLNILVF